MKNNSRALATACCVLTGACATPGGHYTRWEALRDEPSYRDWVYCIEEQTRLRMISSLDTQPPSPEALEAQGKTDGEVFVTILGECRPHMAGFGTDILADDRNKQMIMDAYDFYRRVEIDLRAREAEAIAN